MNSESKGNEIVPVPNTTKTILVYYYTTVDQSQ